MARPIAAFAVTSFIGAGLSLSISLGLIALVLAILMALLIAYSWRRLIALGGAAFGWGTAWALLIGSNYLHCVSMGPDCGGAEGILPFVLVGAVLAIAGSGAAVIGIRRERSSVTPGAVDVGSNG